MLLLSTDSPDSLFKLIKSSLIIILPFIKKIKLKDYKIFEIPYDQET